MATEYVEYNGQHTGEQIDAALTTVGQLKTVATSGSYNDLTNKPTIPAAANNATLTIQKNGVTAGTFTADASTDKTINLSIPTTASDISALPASTKYAGASTAGGAATSAAKLNTNAGSATQPVYFSGGVPVAGTYSLNKTVPADALFTDTTYESKSAASGGTDISLVTTGEKYTWNAVTDKVDKVTGKGLSTNDYTTEEKEKLGGLSGEDLFVLGDELSSNSDINSLTTPGCWRATTAAIATTISNIPADVTTAFFGATIPSITGSRYIQILVPNDDVGTFYKRRYTGSWQSWIAYKATGSIEDAISRLSNDTVKNLLKATPKTRTDNGVNFTIANDGTVTAVVGSGRTNDSTFVVMDDSTALDNYRNRTLYLSAGADGGGDNIWKLFLQDRTSGYTTIKSSVGGDSDPFTVPNTITKVRSILVIYKNCPAGTYTFKPMIRDASYDNSYEPYAPTNRELYETQYTDAMANSTVYGLGSSIASNTDLDSYTTPGVYNCTPSIAATLSHCPTGQSLRLEVKNFASASSYVQTIITPEDTTTGEVVVYRRFMLSNVWKPWYKFTGTVVT